MLAHPNQAVQVAPRRAEVSGRAFAGVADAHAGIDALLNRHLDGPLQHNSSMTPASRARIGEDRPGAAAAPAGLLNAEEPLADGHHALAAALPALRRPRAAPRPGAGTLAAYLLAVQRDAL